MEYVRILLQRSVMEILKNTTYAKISENKGGEYCANAINAGLDIAFGCEQYDFTQADISDFKLSHSHGYSTQKLVPTLYDNNWLKQSTDGIFSANTLDTWFLKVDNEITGTWHLLIDYRK